MPIEYMRKAILRPHVPSLLAVILILATWASWRITGINLDASQKIVTSVVTTRVVEGAYGARTLVVRLHAKAEDTCARVSEHLIYSCEGGKVLTNSDGSQTCTGVPTYYPLAPAISSDGFGFASKQVHQGDPFDVKMSLPDGMADGDYLYVQRSFYMCSWFGGVFRSILKFETTPQVIRLGAEPPAAP